MPELLFPGISTLRNRPELFFCDVDRTILTHDHQLLPQVGAALRALKAINLPVILASARSPKGMQRVHQQIGAQDTVCCFNGAWIGELQQRKTFKEMRIGRDIALGAMSAAHAVGGSPIWFDLDCCYVLEQDQQVARERLDVTGDSVVLLPDIDAAPGAPFKLLTTFPPDRVADAVKRLAAAFPNELTVAQSGPKLVEIVSKSARKDLAAAAVAADRSVDPANVVAAGDSDNDLEMLRWAGLSITVANAKPHIQQVADLVAPSCDDGGLATALEWLRLQVSGLSIE